MNGKTNRGNVSRRNLLKFGAGAIGTGVLTAGLGSKLVLPEPALAENNITPDQALQSLIQGNRRFVRGKSSHLHQDLKDLRTVAKTQKPFATILSCADSRVPSEIIFDQGFGDLFVCRVAGNVVTNEETGSIEFGTSVLGSKLLMVMGHKRCGAVSATLKGASVPGKIGSLIDAIKPALSRGEGLDKDPLEAAVKANVLLQVENLKASPVISQLITEGKLKVVGGYFDLDTGVVTLVS